MSTTKTERPLVIYHGNCADGFTAAWVLWDKFKHYDGADFYPATHNEPFDLSVVQHNHSVIYFVDFMYKYDEMKRIFRAHQYKPVIVLDHHKTAHEVFLRLKDEGYFDNQSVFDMNRSGAGITWDFAYPGLPRPELLNIIEDRDLYVFKYGEEYTKSVASAVFSYPYDFHVWDTLMFRMPIESLYIAGKNIHQKHMKDIKELVEVSTVISYILGIEVPVINLPYTMGTDACAYMTDEHPRYSKYPFAAYYMDTPRGKVFGLRSSVASGIDVAEIAARLGGGGHKHAAGFTIANGCELSRYGWLVA